MFILILLLPLISALFCNLFGRFLIKEGSAILATSCLFITFLISSFAFYHVAIAHNLVNLTLSKWMISGVFFINWGIYLDTLTVVMLVVVTSISTLVHFYSIGYMGEDPHFPRFMSYLSLFTFFMLTLVVSDNFVQMFVGWEGVGLCSYLLINFWNTRIQANKAAIKAMLVNRVGDFGLTLGILCIFVIFKCVNYSTVFSLVYTYLNASILIGNISFNALDIICCLLFIGAIGKSAQIGLHVWLPDAMEGPTPVSALIHAATMVTAGVFMVSRSSPLFEYASNALIFVTIIGACTTFFAASVGLVQNDLKRVIAFSTCSQLGYMIFACGLSSYSVGVFHLANHAFFKALLFLSAGSIIHSMSDEQDMHKLGGLANILPFTYSMIIIGSLALAGFPFLSGFYSKDVILELAFAKFTISSQFAYWFGTISAFLTAFYSIRLIFLTFINNSKAYRSVHLHAHDANIFLGLPLFVLSIGSIFVGYICKDMFVGLGSDFWGNSLFVLSSHVYFFDAEFLPLTFKLLPVIFSILGCIIAYIIYTYGQTFLLSFHKYRFIRKLHFFLNRRWLFDKVYNETVNQFVLYVGYNSTFESFDRGLLEICGPFGLSNNISKKSKDVSYIQTGFFYHYALIFVFGIVAYCLFFNCAVYYILIFNCFISYFCLYK